MERLTLDDLSSNEEHAESRDAWRKRIIALRNARRIRLGPLMSAGFENRELVHWQIQEMCRVEGIDRDDGRENELSTYNPLIPERGRLSLTLMIEIEEAERRRAMLHALRGVQDRVFLEIAGERVQGRPAIRRGDSHGTAAVHFLEFCPTPDQRDAFCRDAGASIVVDHDAYRAEAPIEGDLRATLIEEIRT